MSNVFLVIPTIRNLDFLSDWGQLLGDISIVVMEDGPSKTVTIPAGFEGSRVFHYCWDDIAKDFGSQQWIVGRKNSGVRNYGFWKAYQMGADVIITLDDDCYPTKDNLIEGHLGNLFFKAHDNEWMPTYPSKDWMYTRGFPYGIRAKKDVWVSHGLWSGALDLDGQTEVANGKLLTEMPYLSIRQVVPTGIYYPMCSMNLAFRREATPLMFFPMMGQNQEGVSWGYDRFDDIWAGILSKKILDHLCISVVNGSPFIEHRKKSIPNHNLAKEKAGLLVNEQFWRWVDQVSLTEATPALCYKELAEKAFFPDEPYFNKLREAMIIWANLFI